MTKPVCWIIKSDRYGSTLARNGRFYNMTDPDNFKTYKRAGNAERKLDELAGAFTGAFTAIALYPGDQIDCCGRITRAQDLD